MSDKEEKWKSKKKEKSESWLVHKHEDIILFPASLFKRPHWEPWSWCVCWPTVSRLEALGTRFVFAEHWGQRNLSVAVKRKIKAFSCPGGPSDHDKEPKESLDWPWQRKTIAPFSTSGTFITNSGFWETSTRCHLAWKLTLTPKQSLVKVPGTFRCSYRNKFSRTNWRNFFHHWQRCHPPGHNTFSGTLRFGGNQGCRFLELSVPGNVDETD